MTQLKLIEPDQNELDQTTRENSTVPRGLQSGSEAFVCPGDSHPISRSVHFARLASGFSDCRNCTHRHQQGTLPYSTNIESLKDRAATRTSLLTAEGVRAVYLNELTRTDASNWGAAFASLMWDEQPRFARSLTNRPNAFGTAAVGNVHQSSRSGQEVDDTTRLTVQPAVSGRRGPTVVIGFDERPSSPDIVVGVALGLRRMGCKVIDLGQTSNPCFQFAAHHLDAAGGIYVTGSGCDPAWTGFNLVGGNAIPLSDPNILRELESRMLAHVGPPTRTAGSQRSFHASVPYEAGLWKFFHALRPLKVVCGTSSRQLKRTLESLFARLPCSLVAEMLPVRRRNLCDTQDPDVRRVADRVIAEKSHLGLVVDDDGERCAFLSEAGSLISPVELAILLIDMETRDHHSSRIVVDSTIAPKTLSHISSQDSGVEMFTSDVIQLPTAMLHQEADLGLATNRVWFRGAYPICDAILTLARVLQAMSFSDAPMSKVVAQIAP